MNSENTLSEIREKEHFKTPEKYTSGVLYQLSDNYIKSDLYISIIISI